MSLEKLNEKVNEKLEASKAWYSEQEGKVGYALAWLLGIPLPILVIVYLLRGH